ncbi:hypothetical protein ITP53_18455 [Nonomuraea sp. K274]|uniref:Uncharacterized protein n=1 Tax=Nonomuraea cypriaca TaxID=1187855 RepID=A0A931AEB5_9ACTN|nr:hypothetical protein [Nonomuraea cypriaca]MBF8187682.1 hypothetical protein [Nonomuraea cypriaca]
MTNIAVPELRRYAPDMLRMVGIPLGQADETADMLVWTEAVTGGALRFLQTHRARLNWIPRPRPRVVTESPEKVVVDVRGGSLLEFGIRVFDFVCAETVAAGSRWVQVRNVYGEVFLPYLIARAAERGVHVEAGDGLAMAPSEESAGLTLQAMATDPAGAVLADPVYLDAVDCGIEIADDVFDSIIQLFEMLRVPTSERSRTHAG